MEDLPFVSSFARRGKRDGYKISKNPTGYWTVTSIRMLDIVTTNSGVILSIRTQPGSSKNRIIGEYGGRLKLAVTAAPEKGKANKAVIELLADTLHVHESSIHIISGETSRDKRLMIEGLTLEDLKSLLNLES